MKTFLFTSIVVLYAILFSISDDCQAQTAFGEVAFNKIKPGMTENYLNDMKTSKKLNNGLKANKTINSWQLYRRVYPRGSNMDFDYATLTIFPGSKEMESRKNWIAYDAPLKQLSAKESIDFISSLGNVRTTILTDLYTYTLGVGTASKPGDFVQLNLLDVNPGSNEEAEKMWALLKPVAEECIKAGKLSGYHVWKRTYNTKAGNSSEYTVSFGFSSFEQALSWVSGKTGLAEEYKRIYPKDDFAAFGAKLNSLRTMVGQELWELVDLTD